MDIFRNASALLTHDEYSHPNFKTGEIQKSYIFEGNSDAYEIMLWISTKTAEELPHSFRKKDMKNIILEIIKIDDCANILELFLMRGLNPNIRLGRYPILFVSSTQNMKLLLEYGADPNIKMKCGLDALHYIFSKKVETFEKMKLLILSGANVNYSYKKVSSIENIKKTYGQSILSVVNEWRNQYNSQHYINIYIYINDYELFEKIMQKEEKYQKNIIFNEDIFHKFTNYISRTDELHRKNSLERCKREIFLYLKNSSNMHSFVEMFIIKKKRLNFSLMN